MNFNISANPTTKDPGSKMFAVDILTIHEYTFGKTRKLALTKFYPIKFYNLHSVIENVLDQFVVFLLI